jgi:protein-arginine kinase
VSRFTNAERSLVKSLIATWSLKRFPDKEILKEIERKTGKQISLRSLAKLKRSIKKDSYIWYKSMRETQYDFLHEFKERINEIIDLQRMHHKIIAETKNPSVQQVSLAELHRLSITLSNLYEVAPSIMEAYTTSNNSMKHDTVSESPQQDKEVIV